MIVGSGLAQGFAVAALASGDADGAQALAGLAPPLAAELRGAMAALAAAAPATRRAFLRESLARAPIEPAWRERFRAKPELLTYLAQRHRARSER